MSRAQNDIMAVGMTRAVIGLSTSIQVSPIAYQARIELGQLTGGTLFLGGITANWATGRQFANTTGDHIDIQGAPIMYLCAAGATCTAHITYFLTTVP